MGYRLRRDDLLLLFLFTVFLIMVAAIVTLVAIFANHHTLELRECSHLATAKLQATCLNLLK